MRLENPLLVVRDMGRSVDFYEKVLGLRVALDFGANKVLEGGLALQTLDSWCGFIESDAVSFGGNACEVYFEEDDFDAFAERLAAHDVAYAHPVKEHPWGQRAVRIYDPDGHIVEVGESMRAVCRRFLDSGMTPEQVSARMDVPLDYVEEQTG